MADSVHDTIVVDAPAEDVFAVIADFEAYPEWQDDIKEAEVLEVGEDGWGTEARFVVDAKMLQMELVLAYTYTDSSMHWELVRSDTVRKNTGAYLLEDLGDGRTEVTYQLEVVPAFPLPGALRRKAARRIADAALHALKQRVEAGS